MLPGLLGIVWFVLVVVLYFVSHKPFDAPQALVIAESVYKFTISFSLIALSGGLGFRLMHTRFRWQPTLAAYSSLEATVIQTALGSGVLSLVVLLAGLTIGFPTWFLWGAFGLLLVFLWKDCLQWARGWSLLADIWRVSGILGRGLFSLSGLILGCGLIVALAPPLKFDALVYHLALPQTYLQAERFLYIPWNMFWGMPQAGEMIYLWAMGLAGIESAAILGWLVALITLVGILGYTNSRLGARPAAVASASLLAGLTFAQATSWAYVDYWVMFFGIVFLIFFDNALKTDNYQNYIWVGFFAGFAFASKYTAGILFTCTIISLAWDAFRMHRWSTILPRMGGFLLGWTLPALPWLLKNLFATGNPFYPLLIPAGAMTSTRLDFYQAGQAWGNLADSFFLPLRATLFGHEGSPGYGTTIGPLLFGLGILALPFAFQAGKADFKSGLRSAALIVLPGLMIWAVLGRFTAYLLQSRLYFAFFPALAVLAGGGFAILARIKLPGVRLGRVAGSLVAFVLFLSALESTVQLVQKETLPYLAGISDRQSYLEQNLGWYARAMQSIQALPDNPSVVLLFEPRSLYCLPHCRPDEILDRWLVDLDRRDYSPQVITDWLQEGFTHVLYYRVGAEYLFSEDHRFDQVNVPATDSLLRELPVVADFDGVYILYELNP